MFGNHGDYVNEASYQNILNNLLAQVFCVCVCVCVCVGRWICFCKACLLGICHLCVAHPVKCQLPTVRATSGVAKTRCAAGLARVPEEPGEPGGGRGVPGDLCRGGLPDLPGRVRAGRRGQRDGTALRPRLPPRLHSSLASHGAAARRLACSCSSLTWAIVFKSREKGGGHRHFLFYPPSNPRPPPSVSPAHCGTTRCSTTPVPFAEPSFPPKATTRPTARARWRVVSPSGPTRTPSNTCVQHVDR